MVSFRCFLQGVLTIWLISVSQISLATISQIISTRIWSSLTHTRVMMESNQELNYKQFVISKPDRLVIDLKGINLNYMLKNISAQVRNNDPYIKSVRIGQFNKETVRIVFDLKQDVKLQLFSLAPMLGFKERLIIDLYPINSKNIQDPLLLFLKDFKNKNSYHQMVSTRNSSNPNRSGRDRKIVIMIDPGHGGDDSGAIGKYNTREKDISLKIARRLKALIEKEINMCAYMTRNEDTFIPLKARIDKTKKHHADLFISIHADAFISRHPNGSSVFALSNKGATSSMARYLENTQNSSNIIECLSRRGDRYLDSTIFDMVQSVTINDSLRFGKAVLNRLEKINKLHKNKVEQAEFLVLKIPEVPSILVETAFISNVEEEMKLKTEKFQQEIAESILSGIKTYFSDKKTLSRYK